MLKVSHSSKFYNSKEIWFVEEKTIFLIIYLSNFALFFLKFASGAEIFDKKGSLYFFWRARKINFVDLKKSKIDKICSFSRINRPA